MYTTWYRLEEIDVFYHLFLNCTYSTGVDTENLGHVDIKRPRLSVS
jgi:hypothetical protein